MGIIWSWLGLSLGFCSKVDEKKKISRQIDKEILQELKQEAGWMKEGVGSGLLCKAVKLSEGFELMPFVIYDFICNKFLNFNVLNGLIRLEMHRNNDL